jgi:DNA-nicking Smr family endonuclease
MEEKLDLHGYTVEQAKEEILKTIEVFGNNIERIVVIHGYNNGIKIKEMIRKKLKHKKIEKICFTLNPGISIIELKNKKNT